MGDNNQASEQRSCHCFNNDDLNVVPRDERLGVLFICPIEQGVYGRELHARDTARPAASFLCAVNWRV